MNLETRPSAPSAELKREAENFILIIERPRVEAGLVNVSPRTIFEEPYICVL